MFLCIHQITWKSLVFAGDICSLISGRNLLFDASTMEPTTEPTMEPTSPGGKSAGDNGNAPSGPSEPKEEGSKEMFIIVPVLCVAAFFALFCAGQCIYFTYFQKQKTDYSAAASASPMAEADDIETAKE